MTGGHDCVWLTAQPDLSLTERQGQRVAEHGGLENMIPVFENGELRFTPTRTWLSTDRWVGGSFQGGPREFIRGKPLMRLTVRIRKNDSRLHRYANWRHRPRGKGFDLRSLPYARLWYVYLGVICPNQIVDISAAAKAIGESGASEAAA